MEALTLWQPWATLMAIGAKRVETRGWAMPRKITGAWIALHAAGRNTTPPDELRAAFAVPEIARALARSGHTQQNLPAGAIVAVGLASRSIPTDTLRGNVSPDELAMGYFAAGRHGWLFERVIGLKEPILAKGAQGIWTLTLHTESQVHAQLAIQCDTITGPF